MLPTGEGIFGPLTPASLRNTVIPKLVIGLLWHRGDAPIYCSFKPLWASDSLLCGTQVPLCLSQQKIEKSLKAVDLASCLVSAAREDGNSLEQEDAENCRILCQRQAGGTALCPDHAVRESL